MAGETATGASAAPAKSDEPSTTPPRSGEPAVGNPPTGRRDRLVAAAALGGVFAVAALAYWWTRAPLYNPSGTIDPWLYTALFVNFDQIYDNYSSTYYASRLPWIVPGRLAYGLLPADDAYWVLHGLAFVGGVTALFVLVRRYLGLASAVVGSATLALSPMYWNAQYWDYVDGITLTYLLAGLCLGLPLAGGRLRPASLVAAGVFFGAAVTTNLFVGLVAVIYPILYFFVQRETGLRRRVVRAAKDGAAVAAGGVALVLALGLYARSHGGPFIYFEPQIDVLRAGTGQYKLPDYEWIRSEPRLLAPLFLLVVAAPLLVLGRHLRPFRFAAGSYAGLAFLTAVVYGWEFLAGGNVLELTYYFSYFSIPIALTLASSAALVAALVGAGRAATAGIALAATAGAVISLGAFYREDRLDWVGRTGMRITLAIMAITVLVVLAFVVSRRTRIAAAVAVVAVGAVAASSHVAVNSSYGSYSFSASAPRNGALYRTAIDHVEFVSDATGRDGPLPGFWYSAQNTDFTSVQSMYYYAFTYLDLGLPNVTSVLRERIDLYDPETIVMLCDTRACGGGGEALRRAGYPYAEERARRFEDGPVRFWAVLLRQTADE